MTNSMQSRLSSVQGLDALTRQTRSSSTLGGDVITATPVAAVPATVQATAGAAAVVGSAVAAYVAIDQAYDD